MLQSQTLQLIHTYLIIFSLGVSTWTSHTVSLSVNPSLFSEIQGCGLSSSEETGVIKSQNWPMNYKANSECMWNIVMPLGEKITLKFTDFDLEGKDIITSKCFDNIVVYDILTLGDIRMKTYGK